MSSARSLTPIIYVTDIDASVAFYQLLGFESSLRGDDGEWRWSYGVCGTLTLLIAAGPDWSPSGGPVQLYCQVEDVEQLQRELAGAGAAVEHLGYPDHAPGGEVRALDPDGHAVMLAQTTGAPTQAQANQVQAERAQAERAQAGRAQAEGGRLDGEPDTQSSILRRAAEAVRRRGRTAPGCQVGEPGGGRCPLPGEVKLADTWGDSVWSCLRHADDVLFSVSGAYIATEDAGGLERFLARRRTAT